MKQAAKRFLLGFLFSPVNGGDMFLQNVGWLSADYMALYPRRQNSLFMNSGQLNFLRFTPQTRLAAREDIVRWKLFIMPTSLFMVLSWIYIFCSAFSVDITSAIVNPDKKCLHDWNRRLCCYSGSWFLSSKCITKWCCLMTLFPIHNVLIQLVLIFCYYHHKFGKLINTFSMPNKRAREIKS
jgi:hypothetical protein